jgi:hypothetical protein
MSAIRLFVCVCALFTACLAQAVGEATWGKSTIVLLLRKDVQLDLKISPEQATDIEGAFGTHLRKMPDGKPVLMKEWPAENASKVEDVLTEEQKLRFTEIAIQIRGAQMLAEPRIQKALALSNAQFNAIEDHNDDFKKQLSTEALLAREGRLIVSPEMLDEFKAKLLAVLTADQKAKFATMSGTRKFVPQAKA